MARPKNPHALADLRLAALQEFAAHGVEKARVEDITKRAGRSKGSFYLHFESKEHAFRDLGETMMNGLAGLLSQPPDPWPVPGQTLADLVANQFEKDAGMFQFTWENRALVRLMLGDDGSGLVYLVDGFAHTLIQNVATWLEWGGRHGVFRTTLDVRLASMAIAGAHERVARELIKQEEAPDVRRWVAQTYAVVSRGAGTEAYARAVETYLQAQGLLPPA